MRRMKEDGRSYLKTLGDGRTVMRVYEDNTVFVECEGKLA